MNQTKVPQKARWIAPMPDGQPRPASATQAAYFKAVIHSKDTDMEMKLHISAGQRYCLYVNGAPVLNGPCKGDAWHQYCDVVDIRAYCKPGPNVLVAKVVAFPPKAALQNGMASEMGPLSIVANAGGPMLMLWCEWDESYTTGVYPWVCKTDDAIRWKYDHQGALMGCTEEAYGERLSWLYEENWWTDTGTANAPEAAARWGNGVDYGEIPAMFLYDRPIKYLLREPVELPQAAKEKMQATIPPHTVHEILIDMGGLTTSYVTLRCENGGGSTITLLYSEGYGKKDAQGQIVKEDRCDASGTLYGITDIYHCGGLGIGGVKESYTPFWFRTFRFIKLTIETGAEALTLFPLELVETRYPLVDKVRFHSDASSHWLAPLWKISHRTLALCMHETYEDCPFYEQLQYIMDTRLQILHTYAISNDASMARRTLFDYHSSLMPEGMIRCRYPANDVQVIPLFSLHWIFMLKDYAWETADLDTIRPYRFTVGSILDWFRRKTGPMGLVEKLGYWEFADWTAAWHDRAGSPRAILHGPSTINNLVYAFGLQESAALMDMLGMSQAAAEYREEADAIKSTVNRLCWSNEKQMYREGPAFEEYSQHAQVFAVLSGAITGDPAKRLMENTLSDPGLVPCSFVMQFYLFRALEMAGLYEKTETLWPLWQALLDLNLSTIPEIPGPTTRSDCHAWGSLLLHELPRKFLGVSPMQPGYKKIKIQPKGYFIGDIQGTVPTPYGDVEVAWHYDKESGRFTIKGNTPTDAIVYLPDGAKYAVAAGGFAFEG